MSNWLVLMFHTTRHLRAIQIYWRIKQKFYRPKITSGNVPDIRTLNGIWCQPIQKQQSLYAKWTFKFLNQQYSVKNIGDWDNNNFPKLWRYNLHYFDDLNSINAKSRNQWHLELINKWIKDNRPFTGTAWEPYPSSLRIINWIKWSLLGNKLSSNSLLSLTLQVRLLFKQLEYHILGNHLFSNAKALIFSGLFFEGVEADKWLQQGLLILKSEVTEQIFPDGGHFELSPMYHALVLEDLIDLINLSIAFSHQVPIDQKTQWQNTVCKMLEWLQTMVHPDGELSFFNDSVFKIAAPLDELKKYAKSIGIESSYSIKNQNIVQLCDSGYIRLQNEQAVALLDVAAIGPDYLPGHAHADTLSFELSVFEQRVIVNSGISQYGNDTIRQQQRSTISHNTVCIDGEDSSQVWSGFRVARRAYPSRPKIEKTNKKISILASHDGYHRLAGNCLHTRKWSIDNNSLSICDNIKGSFNNAVACLYFHPSIKIKVDKKNRNILKLLLKSEQFIQIEITGTNKIELKSSFWYPEFGFKVENKCLFVNFSSDNIKILITW